MDAYAVLGVERTQPLEEIEARFRSLLRETHPDVHRVRGQAAEEEAERRTRLLTEAMGQIRSEYAGAAVVAFGGSTAVGGATSGAWVDRAGPGTLARERAPVACPHCAQQFVELKAFEAHLATAHPDSAKATKRAAPTLAQRREGSLGRRLERSLETAALVVAVLVIVVLGVYQQWLVDQFGPWVRPVSAALITMCILLALTLLVMKRRR